LQAVLGLRIEQSHPSSQPYSTLLNLTQKVSAMNSSNIKAGYVFPTSQGGECAYCTDCTAYGEPPYRTNKTNRMAASIVISGLMNSPAINAISNK